MTELQQFEDFLKRYYWDEVLELYRDYPNRKTLVIDYQTVAKFSLESANSLIEHPDQEIKKLNEALSRLDMPADGDIAGAKVAISGLPDSEKIPIHKIRKDRNDSLIAVEGRILRISPVQPAIINAAFKCQKCGEITFMPQGGDGRFVEPFECENDVCERKGAFKLINDKSEFIDQQSLTFQDLHETAKPGLPIRDIKVVFNGVDLIENIPGTGAQCIITGILRLTQKTNKDGKSNLFNIHLDAVHIEPKETEIDITISGAEEKEFQEMASRSDIYDRLISSTSPNILGYSEIKLGLLGCIVSGAKKHIKTLREHYHVLLCGDPGTSKSVMAENMCRYSTRAIYTSGEAASGVGLTAAVVKDENGGYVAQAGALPLADGGVCVIDEFNKMKPEERGSMNSGLEWLEFTVDKANIHQKFNSRCSVIAAMNPIYTRFDIDGPSFPKQVGLPDDLISRFDLIFLIQDVKDPKRDLEISGHMGKRWENRLDEENPGDIPGPIPITTMIKYLAYAKTFSPKVPHEITERIQHYYTYELRAGEKETFEATSRAYNSITRITIAMAKLRLSDMCGLGDVERAIELYKFSQEAIRDPTTGKIDIDILYGCRKSQRDLYGQIRGIIQEHQGNDGVHTEDIVARALEFRIEPNDARNSLPRMKEKGDIFQTSPGFYKVAK